MGGDAHTCRSQSISTSIWRSASPSPGIRVSPTTSPGLWDFMTAFQSGGVKAWDTFVESRRDRPYAVPEVPDEGESGAKQQALEQRYLSSGDRRR
jgi:hypothetical protein